MGTSCIQTEHNKFRHMLKYNEAIANHYVQLNWKVSQFGTYNRYGARIPVPTKMNLDLLDNLLSEYSDREIVEWLKFGWPIGRPLDAPDPEPIHQNHKGANMYPQHIDQYLKQEIQANATIGPFITIPFKERVGISPINSRSKRSDPYKRRIILDLSLPKFASVNDYIPKDHYLGKPFRLTYPTIDTLAKRVHKLGTKAKIYRVDEERSFRQNPLDPIDYGLIGVFWKGLYFFDVNSPQGLRTGAMFCQRFTNSIRYIMNKMGYFLLNYLDDLHGCELEDKVWDSFHALIRLMRDINRDIAHSKTTEPTDVIEVLGIWFDVVLQIIVVSPDRMSEIMLLFDDWRFKSHATKKEMQKLIGKLQFVAKCVRPGRVFIARLLRWMHRMNDSEYKCLNDNTRADIKWWYYMIPRHSSVSVAWHLEIETPDLEIASDSNLTGCGAHNDYSYFHCLFPEFILRNTNNIAQRELIAIAASLKVFGGRIRGKRVTFLCDNQASVACVNSGRAKDEYMQQTLREIAYLAAVGDFCIRTQYIDTRSNRPADILSRWEEMERPKEMFLNSLGNKPMLETQVSEDIFKFTNNW